MLRRAWHSLDSAQRRSLWFMTVIVLGLHVAGFTLLVVAVAGHHLAVGRSGAFAIGTGVTAYVLGLRHAFDADHIAAIDNTTRKLMAEGRRPMSVGFWFSLGHSTIVLSLAILFAVGVRALAGGVRAGHSTLHDLGDWIGTGVSGTFLYVIAALNLVVLWGIVKVFIEMRAGAYDEQELELQLRRRGFMNRFFARLGGAINAPWQMYPLGLLFGLGFDTATEVALLFLAAGAAGAGLPVYAILCLPLLFAAGMSLLDTIDGSFMNFAYGWAFSKPVRKVFYNLTITGLSVAIALVIGTIELAGLLARKLGAQGAFWSWWEHIDVGTLGLIIAGLFAATWLVALAIWRFGRIEERWDADLRDARARLGASAQRSGV